MMKYVVLSVMVCVSAFTFEVNAQGSHKHGAAEKPETAEPARKQPVKNEVTFNVPERQQQLMKIKTETLTGDDKGHIRIPNASVQVINKKPSIILSMGKNTFAFRYVEVVKKTDTHSLIKANANVGEVVVTDGADKLKAGIERMLQGQGHGHSHGPGGHSH